MTARGLGSIQLARLFGIRIGADVSWFVILFLLIISLSTSFRSALDSSQGVAYATAVASALLFFASVVVHELGHALAARRSGIETEGIHLWIFGGIARLSRDARTPGEEFRMAAAGPAVTFLVIVVCVGVGVGLAGSEAFLDAARLADEASVSPPELLLSWLASINLLLLLFNLVPAYPLDGGRILRAAIWRGVGDKGRGTRAAARIGQGFAYLLVGLGLFLVLSGSLSGLWLVILGFLLGGSARGAVLQSHLAERLEAVRVADIMDSDPVGVPEEATVDQALHEYLRRYGADWLPVVDSGGYVRGIVTELRARAGGDEPLHAIVDPAEELKVTEQAGLDALLASEPLRRHGALVAVDAEGRLRGIVSLQQVQRALSAAATA